MIDHLIMRSSVFFNPPFWPCAKQFKNWQRTIISLLKRTVTLLLYFCRISDNHWNPLLFRKRYSRHFFFLFWNRTKKRDEKYMIVVTDYLKKKKISFLPRDRNSRAESRRGKKERGKKGWRGWITKERNEKHPPGK